MHSREIRIGKQLIGMGHPPFIIAEMSGNHNQSLSKALKIVESAADSGVHALKIQTYKPETMTLDLKDGAFLISNSKNLWSGKSLYKLYQEAYTPWEWHQAIFDKAKECGLIIFSTPFDETAVDFLEELKVPCYKISSFENTDIPLLKKVAKTGKPIIISTGMANVAELDESVRTVRDFGCDDLVLLKCTSTYPASEEDSNLLTIPHMRELFQCEVGLSDHTLANGVAQAAVALGATVIEKHFTLSRSGGGVDSAFSLEPDELANLVKEVKSVWRSLGQIAYGPTKNEEKSLVFRRSIYISKDMKKGEKFSKENIRIIRPGFGLPPKYIDRVMGRQIKIDTPKGTPLSWDII